MAFNNEEILTLAKAGFTAQQIAALAQIGTPAQPDQAAAPVPQTVEQPATVPAVPEVTAPETAPATPAQADPSKDELLAAITGLKSEVQNMFLQNASQSGMEGPKTSEQILAEIINPTRKENK